MTTLANLLSILMVESNKTIQINHFKSLVGFLVKKKKEVEWVKWNFLTKISEPFLIKKNSSMNKMRLLKNLVDYLVQK